MDRGAFDPSGITHFVLDEADHMLDLGFYPPIKRIASSIPRNRQTMLFSATMPPAIEKLANEFLTDPVNVKAPQTGITADKVTQRVTLMAESDKRDRLCDILNEKDTGQTLIFVRTWTAVLLILAALPILFLMKQITCLTWVFIHQLNVLLPAYLVTGKQCCSLQLCHLQLKN